MYRFVYVILNYRTYDLTISQIEELYDSKLKDRLVLVVDNASPNNSFEILSSKYNAQDGIEIIQSSVNGGFAKGNNFGLKYIEKYSPEYVCIINNDVHFDRNLVDRLAIRYDLLFNPGVISPLQLLPNGSVLNCRPLEKPTFKTDCERYLIRSTHQKRHIYKESVKGSQCQAVFTVPGAFIFGKYDRLKQVGFFYEGTFLYGEENFLGARMECSGYHNYLILNESYLHDHGKTITSQKSNAQRRKLIYQGVSLFSREVRKDGPVKRLLLYMTYLFYRLRTMRS